MLSRECRLLSTVPELQWNRNYEVERERDSAGHPEVVGDFYVAAGRAVQDGNVGMAMVGSQSGEVCGSISLLVTEASTFLLDLRCP